MTDSEKISALQIEIERMREELNLIINLISRNGISDRRILDHSLEILDRLHALDGK